ncbi:MAG: tetratricopeptide repeat protein [Pseudanabaenaceae cyanobacterium bins.68]|nr:tetratricopeptide repeat protein [Pseudanabaenaceae cyanobacterium bins.68]
MEDILAIAYLGALVALLGILGWLILQQIRKNRRMEMVITNLQPKLQNEKGEPLEHYQLGSIYLRKKLYAKALSEFQRGLKAGGEQIPEIYNAIGFAYFAQNQFDLAIKNYKESVTLQPSYLAAWNNLGNAYESKKLIPQALEAYEQALAIAPDNQIAQRRATALRKRLPN